MPITLSPQKQRYTARQLLVIIIVFLIFGAQIVFQAINANNRGRASLQWPRTTGTMTQCDEIYQPGIRHAHSSYSITATYTYAVNNQRYIGHQITLWNPDLRGQTGDFAATHPVSSVVDVHYDPQNPGNAVLIPGADEAWNQNYIILGSLTIVCAILMAFRLPPSFAQKRQ